jgi:mRNA interferase YafQ
MKKGRITTKIKPPRDLEPTTQFKKDLKRELKGRHRKTLKADLETVLDYLRNDSPLPENFFDHPLKGDWQDFRDCHIKPDLVLIYQKIGDSILSLTRLGSHAKLFG